MRTWLHFMDWPLRAKMAALLVVASILPLLVTAFIDVRDARQRLGTNTADLLAARGDHLADQIDAFHRTYQVSVAKFARLPLIVQFCGASPEGSERLKPTLGGVFDAYLGTDPNVRGVVILDMAGRVRVATQEQLIGENLSRYSYVREALPGGTVISDVHLAKSPGGNEPTIAYLAPVIGIGGKPVAIAMLWVRASSLWGIMKKANELAGPGSFAVLYDHQGIRIGHTYNEEIVFHPGGRLAPATLEALVAERRFGEQTRQLLEDVRAFPEQFDRARATSPTREMFRGFSPVNQNWNYGVARRFETVPWTIFYMIPEQSLITQIAIMTGQKTIFAGVIILIALLGGSSFAAVILKPIVSLSTATGLIAGGQLTARVRTGRADELGRLGTSFNSMAKRIEAQATILRRASVDLELRVQERTAALVQTTQDLELEIAERKRAEQALRGSEEHFRFLDDLGEATRTLTDPAQIMAEMARMLGEHLHASRCAYADVEQDGEYFTILHDYTDGCASTVGNYQLSLFGARAVATLYSGQTLIIRSVEAELLPGEGADMFNAIGIKAIITCPLVKDGVLRAMMAVHQTTPRDWQRGEIAIVQDVVERCWATIERRTAEEKVGQLNVELEHRVAERTAELEAANKELEAFSYSVSHDLRAPLRHINGFSQALLEDYADKLDEEGKGYLQQVRGASQEMAQLIDDILQLARVTRSEMHREVVDLSDLAQSVVAELRKRDAERPVTVQIEEGLLTHGDRRLLRIMLNNLLGNAWKFTSKQQPAEIGFGRTQEGDELVYFVCDNGAGFDMAYVKKLFGAFQRLHTATEFEGTGIGLATVQRVINRHGGRVWAEGTENEGATFYFTLPSYEGTRHGEQNDPAS